MAVLVAIAIPVFTSQLEKSREATDLANIRSAYAEVTVAAIEDNATSVSKTVSLKQQVDGWVTKDAESTLSTIVGSGTGRLVRGASPKKGGNCVVSWAAGSGADAGHAVITFSE